MNDDTRKTLAPLESVSTERLAEIFASIREDFDREAAAVHDAQQWKQLHDAWLGRKSGVLANITENWLKPAPREVKSAIGQSLNALRAHVEAVCAQREKEIRAAAEESALARERVDLSLPGTIRSLGCRHPLRQTFEEIERIFLSIGFSVVEGPEIETPYYNFDALNIPETHPARDTMDTFYVSTPAGASLRLLRTHTSPMQVRTMENRKPPVRIIVPGRVYRRENPDASHSFAFHQIEGLAVDRDISFADFKGTIEYFAGQFFGPRTRVRLRPSYFPFTEPSVEFDASCYMCEGSGCRLCKQSGWIELFGAGMVNPAVYQFVDYDPKQYCGFAFGLGVDRLAMIKFGITDIQLFFQNDARFLRQFP